MNYSNSVTKYVREHELTFRYCHFTQTLVDEQMMCGVCVCVCVVCVCVCVVCVCVCV